MRVCLLLLVACSSKPCPTADDLAAHAKLEARDATFLAEHCANDRWPGRVIDCMRDAATDLAIDACLKQLDDDHKALLKTANHAEGIRDAAREKRAKQHWLDGEFAKLHADELFDRDPACKQYRHTITAMIDGIVGCDSQGMLELFGMQQQILGDVRALLALESDALPAACARVDAALKNNTSMRCK